MANAHDEISKTFNREGGFQNHAEDSANYVNGVLIGTNRGISAQAYQQYFKKVPTVVDMKALTAEQAEQIFKANYWDKIGGDYIANQSVAALMFQYIIGSGASQISDVKDRANETAGKAVLVSNDLPITKTDAAFINGLDQAEMHANLKAWRFAFYDRVIAADIAKWEKTNARTITEKEALTQTKKKFLAGWRNRLNQHVFKP